MVTEIFARLNQGAVELSDQEIRHALFSSKFDDLLVSLSEREVVKDFGSRKDGTSPPKDSRELEELLLRFFAFHEAGDSYEGNLSKFLDSFMSKAMSFDDAKLTELKQNFDVALNACREIFDDDEIFTDISKERRRQGVVYYDLLMNSLGDIQLGVLRAKRAEIRQAFVDLCSSEEFRRSTAGGLQRKSSINRRNTEWSKRLEEVVSA